MQYCAKKKQYSILSLEAAITHVIHVHIYFYAVCVIMRTEICIHIYSQTSTVVYQCIVSVLYLKLQLQWKLSIRTRLEQEKRISNREIAVVSISGGVYFTERNGTLGYFTERTSVIMERLI